MLASFSNWNSDAGYLKPEFADIYVKFDEYQIIMRALKAYAVENDVYTEVAETVKLISDIEAWYKIERDRVIKEEE